MAARQYSSEELIDAFELYLERNGERHDLIEREMHRRGWSSFRKESIKSRGFGTNRREGLAEKYGWDKALEIRIAAVGKTPVTSAESLLGEVETVRKKLYLEIVAKGPTKVGRDLIVQHEKYVQRSTEILDKLDKARDNFGNFVAMYRHLMQGATSISPALARELCDAEDALLGWAEKKFTPATDSNDNLNP